VVFIVVVGWLTPRLIHGHAAFQWTRYHVAVGPDSARPGDHARQAGRWAARTIELTAPLPFASSAARQALTLGRTVQDKHGAAALALYTDVRQALDGARASRVRGLGLGGLADEARRLEIAATPRPASSSDGP
jgi:hypothetical protein